MCTVQNHTESNFLALKCLDSFHLLCAARCLKASKHRDQNALTQPCLPSDNTLRLIFNKFQKKILKDVTFFFLTFLFCLCFSALLLTFPTGLAVFFVSQVCVTQQQFGGTELFADDLYPQHLWTAALYRQQIPPCIWTRLWPDSKKRSLQMIHSSCRGEGEKVGWRRAEGMGEWKD